MVESTAPQTPEEAAALRELAAMHRRRHRWVALVWRVGVSVHTTVILHTVGHAWPLDARELGWLAVFVVNALVGLGMLEWGLRGLRQSETLDRQWTQQTACWRAQDRAWRERWAEHSRPLGDGYTRACPGP